MMTIRRYTATDKSRWDEFVANAKNATFLHFRDYMDYHADRFADCSLMAFNEKGRLTAVLPANIDGNTLYSHQGLTYGGWLTPVKHFNAVTMLDVFGAMMDFLKQSGIKTLVYKAVPYIYHRYPADEDLYALFRYGAQPLTVNLSSVVVRSNPLFGFDRRARRTCDLAKSNGVTVCQSDDMPAFWKILSDNLKAKYAATPVHSLEEITRLQSLFPDKIKLYLSVMEKETVAGALVFDMGEVVHVQYSSANEKGSLCGALGYLFATLVTETYGDRRFFDFGTSNEDNGRILNDNLIAMKSGYGARGVAFNIFKLDVK